MWRRCHQPHFGNLQPLLAEAPSRVNLADLRRNLGGSALTGVPATLEGSAPLAAVRRAIAA